MAEANLRAVTHKYAVVLGLVHCGGNLHALTDQCRHHRRGCTRAVERGQQYGARCAS
jgi:hypothetical protein